MAKTIRIFAAVMAAALLAGCTKKPPVENSSETSLPESSSSAESLPVSSEPESSLPESSAPESSAPAVVIYDDETSTTTTTPLEDEDGDRDAALVKALNDTFASGEYQISLNSVEEKDGGLYIDFADGSIPLAGVGSSEETACLKSIAETFLNGYPNAKRVYFSVDGGTGRSFPGPLTARGSRFDRTAAFLLYPMALHFVRSATA